MIKHGRTASGRQRFRCKTCASTQTRSNNVRARDFGSFLEFITSRSRQVDLPGQGRTFRRRSEEFWSLWPTSVVTGEVYPVLYVDGIYLRRKAVVLIACTDTHVVGWYVARTEKSQAWKALFARIAPPGLVVCDGGSGIASALKQSWPTTRVQHCTFHAFNAVKRQTTSRPRTQAGVDLYRIAKALLYIHTPEEAVAWLESLSAWNHRYKNFLAERTPVPGGGSVPTHKRLITAKNALNTLARKGTLFTFLEPELRSRLGALPSTNNMIEGGVNTQLRAMLRDHRGMSLNRQIKAVCWWCYLHTEDPPTPAEILSQTYTDSQIAELFANAHHFNQAQNTIDQWGIGINWTDFHHSATWNNTY